jgi:hypothetical protein
LRNEVVEELIPVLLGKSGANRERNRIRGNKNSGMENEKGRKIGERGQRDAFGEANLSEAREERGVPSVWFKLLTIGQAKWQSLREHHTA